MYAFGTIPGPFLHRKHIFIYKNINKLNLKMHSSNISEMDRDAVQSIISPFLFLENTEETGIHGTVKIRLLLHVMYGCFMTGICVINKI